MRAAPRHTIIAGVNKAGTTSLFVTLSAHPGIAPSAVKETRYFLPARYGQPLAPVEAYEQQFPARDGRVRLEASPSYFYGGAAVADAIAERVESPRIVVVMREPVARALSFFSYQKARLRIPVDLSIEEYLATEARMTAADFLDPANEPYFAVGGSRYADFLPAWVDRFGADSLHVAHFEDLIGDPATALKRLASWLDIDPEAFPSATLSSENRTTGFRRSGLQRAALAANDRLERVLRRAPQVKRALRAAYYRVNGAPMREEVPDAVRAELASRFSEPNARLRAQLQAMGAALPPWLA